MASPSLNPQDLNLGNYVDYLDDDKVWRVAKIASMDDHTMLL